MAEPSGAAQFPALAQYFVKFLQAYQAQQIPVYAVSMQNEPLYSTAGYPSATVAPADQAAFIGHHLGPALAAAGFGGTKILAYDRVRDWRGAELSRPFPAPPHKNCS